MSVRAVVLAAGEGRRFRRGKAEVPEKPYALLGSKPVLAHSLEAVSRIREVETIVVVVSPGREAFCRERVIQPYGISKVSRIVAGGKERSDSVWKGLSVLAGDTQWVLIHDGARPFLAADRLGGLLSSAFACGAAVFAVPIKSTVKEVRPDGKVLRTLDRGHLREIQTPQVFRMDVIMEAYRTAGEEVWKTAPDDAYLVERAGGEVRVVEGDERNIKITTPFDLEMAEGLITKSSCV